MEELEPQSPPTFEETEAQIFDSEVNHFAVEVTVLPLSSKNIFSSGTPSESRTITWTSWTGM
jgi:hypothetical protein